MLLINYQKCLAFVSILSVKLFFFCSLIISALVIILYFFHSHSFTPLIYSKDKPLNFLFANRQLSLPYATTTTAHTKKNIFISTRWKHIRVCIKQYYIPQAPNISRINSFAPYPDCEGNDSRIISLFFASVPFFCIVPPFLLCFAVLYDPQVSSNLFYVWNL